MIEQIEATTILTNTSMLNENETCHWIDRYLYARKLKDFHKDLARITQQRDEEEKKNA